MTEPMGRTFAHTIANLARSIQTTFDARLRSMGLTAARGRVLLYLVKRPIGVTQSELTEFLKVEHPTAVRILDGLEELGYIERQMSPHDRRAKLIVLTAQGRPIAEDVEILSHTFLSDLLNGLTAEELAVTAAALGTIASNVEAMNAQLKPGADEQVPA